MPYFDGDYWPGSADEQLAAMEAEKDKSASKVPIEQTRALCRKMKVIRVLPPVFWPAQVDQCGPTLSSEGP